MRISALAAAAGLALATSASAQQFVMAVDSGSATRGVKLLRVEDGSVVNTAFIAGAGPSYTMTTPKHAMQVEDEIWVSDQVADSVFRFDLEGNYLSTISGGMDNIRGMGYVEGRIYVTNSGTGNGAPGNAVVMFDATGASQGFFSTVGTAPSPFGVLAYQGGILVSSSSANDDIHRYTLSGTPLGTFHNSGDLSFAQQMIYAASGEIIVAGFSTPAGLKRLDATTGAFLGSIEAAGPRGIFQLGNGNLLWSNSAGIHVHDVLSGLSTLVLPGNGQYLDLLDLSTGPKPCYANCDNSTAEPILNVADFGCFLTKFAASDPYANCDESTAEPILNVADFGCFLTKFAAGCP